MAGGKSLPSNSSTSKPSHSGICTSRKTKSGFATRISSSASRPEPHSPMTSTSGSSRRSTARLLRASGSSSTITARIFIFADRSSRLTLSLLAQTGNEWHRQRYFHAARLPIPHAQLKRLSIQALQTRSHIRQPNPVMRLLPPRSQTRTIVINAQLQPAIRPNRRNPDHASLHALRNSMLHRILDHGLQNQIRDLRREKFPRHVHAELQPLGESHFLNIQILLRKLQFLFQRHLLPV